MASKDDHCLLDLLWRNRRGELQLSIAMVIANHPDLAERVRPFGVPFIHIPATRDTRAEAEQRQLQLLSGNVDLVVLARYMQILTPEFLAAIGCPMINIHHSFLPAFIGAAPYKRARERGVKLVGATAHYVTAVLDEGPIIEQDVVRVRHTDTVDDLVRVGADVERAVLSRAVLWHCQDRVIVHDNQTIVFWQLFSFGVVHSGVAEPGAQRRPDVGILSGRLAICPMAFQKLTRQGCDETLRIALPAGLCAHLGQHVGP